MFYGVHVIDMEGNAIPTDWNPASNFDVSKSWMWHDVAFLDVRAAAGNSSMSTVSREILIKSKRVLKAGQGLVLSVYDLPLSGVADEVYMLQGLRTLISHVD